MSERAARPLQRATLVGRVREMERLRNCLARPPSVVLLAGEAGSGASRLVAETLDLPELAGHRRVMGRCHSLQEPFPLGVLIDALCQVRTLPSAGARSTAATAWCWHVPELRRLMAPSGMGQEPSDAMLLQGLVELLQRLGPAVLVAEDLQWIDSRSARLLRLLVPRLPADAVLIVTRRAGGVDLGSLGRIAARARPGTAVEHLFLAPLDVAGVRQMAVAMTSREVSGEFAAALWSRTGGLPRLVGMVMRRVPKSFDLLADRSSEVNQALRAIEVPRSLADEVLSGVLWLGDDAMRVVEAASVLGSAHDAAILGEVAGLPAALASRAARKAVDHGVLARFGSTYGFRAPLAAEAVYGAIPGPLRRRQHELAARALRSRRPPPWVEVARHSRESGDARGWSRCVDAATAPLADPAAAVELLQDVILDPEITPAMRARLASRLGTAALRAEAPAVARPLLQRVIDEHQLSGAQRAEVRWSLGCLHLAVGDAEGWTDQRVAAAEDLRRRPESAALVMMELAMPWVEHGRSDEHRRWLDRAAAAAARQHDPVVTLCVGAAGALVALYAGDPAAWSAIDAIPWDATSHAERLQLIWAAQNLAGACFHLGHYDRARSLYDEGARRACELARSDVSHIFRAAEISLAWCTGRWHGLDIAAHEYLKEVSDLPGWTLHGHLVLGHLQLARGDLDEAEHLLRAAADAAHVAGAIPGTAVAAGGLARILLARGDPAAACTEAAPAVGLVARKGMWVWAAPVIPPMVQALIGSDRLNEATQVVERFADGISRRDAPLALAALQLCRGIIESAQGDHVAAAASLDDAIQIWHSLPRPHDAAAAMALRGISLMELGDPSGAEVVLAALAVFEGLGASADADRVRRTLRERSVVVPQPWRGGRKGYGMRLSPRQQRVVDLASAGRTNVEIGRALFISEKTVEDHLRSAMQKLGVLSKRDLRYWELPGQQNRGGRADDPGHGCSA